MSAIREIAEVVRDSFKNAHDRVDKVEAAAVAAEESLRSELDELKSGLESSVSEISSLKSALKSAEDEISRLKAEFDQDTVAKAVDSIKSSSPSTVESTSHSAEESEELPVSETAAPETKEPSEVSGSVSSGEGEDGATSPAPAPTLAPEPAALTASVGMDSTVVRVPSSGTTVTLDHATGEATGTHDASQTPVEPDAEAVAVAKSAAEAAGVTLGQG